METTITSTERAASNCEKQSNGRSKHTNPSSEEIKDVIHGEKFLIQKSIRYHSHRNRFFDNIYNTIITVSAISGTTACALLFGGDKSEHAKWITGIAAFATTLDLVFSFNKKATAHWLLKNQFIDLLIDYENTAEDNNAEIKKIVCKRMEIEKNEPLILKVLDTHCFNEQCIANGDNDYIHTICWLKLVTKQFFSYAGWKPKTNG